MTPSPALSSLSNRTAEPPIGDLMQRALANPDLISLAAGFVDNATLPVEAVARAVAAVLADGHRGRQALQYGTNIGNPRLRDRLLELLERSEEGVARGSFAELMPRLVVTNGSQQLLYLIAEALLDPGDIVLVEAPTYFVFLDVVKSRGAVAVGVAIDEGGMRIDALEATLEALEAQGRLDRVKLIYTISEHSNPSGLSLARERRGPLVELARRWSRTHRIYVLEDSAYRGLTYLGAEPPSVWRHDLEGETVILARTFSKTFSPGLRTGYGVLPEPLVRPILDLKTNHDFGSGHFGQLVIEQALADGSYEEQVTRLRATYRRKRDIVLEALEDQFAGWDGVSWTRPAGGLYVWLTLPPGVDAGRDGPLFARCLSEGVLYVPGGYAFPEEPGPIPGNHMRLSFGVPGDDELVEGIRRLASALSECLVGVGG